MRQSDKLYKLFLVLLALSATLFLVAGALGVAVLVSQ